MGKREILRAFHKAGAEVSEISYAWEPTPGESVPCWSIYLTDDSADYFGVPRFHQFDNSASAVQWAAEIAPYTD